MEGYVQKCLWKGPLSELWYFISLKPLLWDDKFLMPLEETRLGVMVLIILSY